MSTVAMPEHATTTQATCWEPAYRTWALLLLVLVGVLTMTRQLEAQMADAHYRFSETTPPGAIGSWQLQRGGPLPGYFQPVEIMAPPGVMVSLAADGKFTESQPVPVVAGMLIGSVYRLKVTGLPLQPGKEIFPTIEVIDRIYPPPGKEGKFPIPVDLTREELELALAGHMVTRVIYLEDPNRALPIATDDGEQSWFDAGPGANPLQVADALGRPVAILRIGGRLPLDSAAPDIVFLHGSPPWLKFSRPEQAAQRAVPFNTQTNLPPLRQPFSLQQETTDVRR